MYGLWSDSETYYLSGFLVIGAGVLVFGAAEALAALALMSILGGQGVPDPYGTQRGNHDSRRARR
jgi:hypothetical protein